MQITEKQISDFCSRLVEEILDEEETSDIKVREDARYVSGLTNQSLLGVMLREDEQGRAILDKLEEAVWAVSDNSVPSAMPRAPHSATDCPSRPMGVCPGDSSGASELLPLRYVPLPRLRAISTSRTSRGHPISPNAVSCGTYCAAASNVQRSPGRYKPWPPDPSGGHGHAQPNVPNKSRNCPKSTA